MTRPAPFGRRAPRAAPPARPTAARETPPLSPQAEAFRRDLAGVGGAPSEFERWRRAQRLGRWGAWALSFALMASGLLSFVAKAPLVVSGFAEIGGLALGAWLRRERRRRIAEVAAWRPEPTV